MTNPKPPTDSLTAEHDALLDSMQGPVTAQRLESAFAASPEELGRAALDTGKKTKRGKRRRRDRPRRR